MAISSDDLFALAHRLSTCPDEASQRAAISRAYYASYHRCLEWEKQLPAVSTLSGKEALGVHASLIRRLRRPHQSCSPADASRSISIGKRLNLLRKRRGLADYDIELPIPYDLVAAQLAMTQALLDECCGKPPPSKATRRKRR